MTLSEYQQAFKTWLVSASDDSAQALGARAAGLDVYQNNYRAQLVGCLEQAFPNLKLWIGDDAFLAAAVNHIDSFPPHAWTLDAYPGGFHKTLVTMFPHNPDVHELAWIELALNQAFIAPDAAGVPMDQLAAVDWDHARLVLTPSLHCRSLTTNAETIWSALWQQDRPPEAEMLPEPGGLIVWRRQFTSRLRETDALEYEALLQLQSDSSFAGLCEFLVRRLGDEEGTAKAGGYLANWLTSELIVGIN
ncbi:putative DNA-binding domain-containing protein [Pseudomonas sp. NPDC088444]|uniref:HvfC/BufC family peptide modification chaperone n=1 Tax=Pseudomonas sp. NPDC088444 TaxID=3364456 RepID=UPI0038512AE7